MKRFLGILVLLAFCVAPSWGALSADYIVKHFEDNQKWVQAGMVAFQVQKKASDAKIADLYDFTSEKTYGYEGMIINGDAYKATGPLAKLMATIGDGVLGVVQKQTTNDRNVLFKPTWIGYHTPGDKRVSNWFCLMMGDHVKTYLTRIDQKAKLDELGADPLVMNVLKKDLFEYELLKDLGDHAILRVTPRKNNSSTNLREAVIELARIKIGSAETWYATKISGTLTTGAKGVTEFGNFRVAIAPVGKYIAYSNDNSLKSDVPVMDIATAMNQQVQGDQKIYIFATQIRNTTYQSSKEISEYECDFLTTIQRLHINPPCDLIAKYLDSGRLEMLQKVTEKVVRNH
ncbi:MAG: hypothetical protein HQM08_29060 [Candidatus Riflebacteria bacterium]|nr:hypothetical protein [Candidatus Riflebacteria bacterium]